MELPHRFVGNIKSNALRHKILFGLIKEIRNSIRFRYNNPKISYSHLCRLSREIGVEEGRAGSGSKGKTNSRTKAMASSAIVLDSAWTNQDGASSDSDLDNLRNLASKIEEENKKTQSLLKEIQDEIDAIKGQGHVSDRGARGVAIMEMVEVEEMTMAGEALIM